MLSCHVSVLTIDLIDLIRPLKPKYVQLQIRLLYILLIVASGSILY